MYRLVYISPTGRRLEIETGFDLETLIFDGGVLQKQHPDNRFAVVDEADVFVWPHQSET